MSERSAVSGRGSDDARWLSPELVGWSAVALVLVALAVPWFMWGDSTVVAWLPLWIWWHVGWMAVATVVFYVFTQRAWGLGVAEVSDRG